MDPEERARREQEQVLKDRERLRFRVYSAVRDVTLGTDLFRSHFQLHEPEIVVNVYARFVDVNTSLNEAQLRLLPARGRPRNLNRFAEELRAGAERVAADLHLEFTTDPARFGGSDAVMLVGVPVGYRAVLLRSQPE
ncbi:MAG: hypothetical protein ABSB97_08065 [Thermoplasmata archaeon]